MTATRRLLNMLYILAVLQLWSCSSDEAVSTGEMSESEVMMTFDVSAEQAQTRGEAISSTSFAKDDRQFKLWCWMTDDAGTYPMTSDFNKTPLTEIPVTYNTVSGWTTEQTFYWPRPKYRADFFAIYPANITEVESPTATISATTKTITYTTDIPFDGETDLMYATYSDQRPVRDNSEKSRTVYLTFRHAMAQIIFYGKLSAEFKAYDWNVEVKKIEIHNMNGAGVFSLKSAYDDLGSEYGIGNNKGIGTASALELTPNSPSTLTTYTPALNINSTDNPANTMLLDDDQTVVPLTLPNDILMVLPQNLPAWDITTETSGTTSPTTSGGYLAIDLRIVDVSGGTTTPVYPLKANGDFVTVYVPFGSTSDGTTTADATTPSPWLGGKLYKYKLIFGVGLSAGGKSIIQPIVIEAAIAPWQEATPVTGTIKH